MILLMFSGLQASGKRAENRLSVVNPTLNPRPQTLNPKPNELLLGSIGETSIKGTLPFLTLLMALLKGTWERGSKP